MCPVSLTCRSRVGLLLALLIFALPGCRLDSPERDLSKAAIGTDVIEFHYPQGSSERLAVLAMGLLEQDGADSQGAVIPAVSGSLDGSSFETDPSELSLQLSAIEMMISEGLLEASLEVDVSDPVLTLGIFTGGQPTSDCEIHVSIPRQVVPVRLVAGQGNDNQPLIFIDGELELIGEPVSAAMDPYCPAYGSQDVELAVSRAVAGAVLQASTLLADALSEALGSTLGLDAAAAGCVAGLTSRDTDQGRLHFEFWPGADADVFSPKGSRVGLAGGFESTRADCVPAAAADFPGSKLLPAEFAERVPGTGDEYQCAISISDDFLQQAFTAAWRGGLFCRNAADGDLQTMDLVDLFPSLAAWGPPGAVRVALWPGGQPQLAFAPADPDAGESLARLSLSLPSLAIDLYVSIEGSDMRMLGLAADLNLELAPRIEGTQVFLDLVKTHVGELSIDYSEMLTEAAGSLRALADEALSRIARQLLSQLGPLEVPMVPGAASLLGFKRLEGRTLLYFGP